jgi:hypothetical protein
MIRIAIVLVCMFQIGSTVAVADDVIVVVGAAGEASYGQDFQQWAQRWTAVQDQSHVDIVRIGFSIPDDEAQVVEAEGEAEEETDREQLLSAIKGLESSSETPLWIVLIGHGTFQRGVAKFNLQGPDISVTELQQGLANVRRPVVLVNCASASGPFLTIGTAATSTQPSFPRTVITATRSGDEQNFARFGQYLSLAIDDLAADLDHDGQVSILEAFLKATDQTRQFYEADGRLITENALIEDNGDGVGTPASFFRGVRVIASSADDAKPDGNTARRMVLRLSTETLDISDKNRKRIAELEVEIEALRGRKTELDIEKYYQDLEVLMRELAGLES